MIFLIPLACQSPTGISGVLEGTESKDIRIYLLEPESLQQVAASFLGKVIDSATVNPDGSFELRNLPQTKEPILLELAVQQPGKAPNYLQTENPFKANYMPIVWQTGERLEISARLGEFQNSFSIEQPSEANSALMDLRNVKEKAYQKYLAGKHWQVEDGSQLLEKENALLQYQRRLIEFANNTKQLFGALVALRWVSPENYYERIPEFLVNQCDKWKIEQPDHPWVKELCEQSDPSNLPVLIGDDFPDLKLPTLQKDTLSLRDHLGSKVTIIDLWASWCAPCRKENREVLVPLWEQYHERGLNIIAYGLESNESAWKAAAERDGADQWLQVSNLEGDDSDFLKRIRVRTIPANFILDDKGVVVAKNIHGEALKELVKTYIR